MWSPGWAATAVHYPGPSFILGSAPEGRRWAVSPEHSAWILPREEQGKAVSPPPHTNLPDDWAQWGGDLPSRLGGSCPAR